MIRFRYLLLLATLLVGQLFAFARPTFACSCMMPPAPEQALSDSTVVFAGRVIEAPAAGEGGMVSSADAVPYTFEVSEVWKGDAEPAITVRTARDSASCGFNFEAGQEYIVYATVVDGLLSTNLCSRTAPLASAEQDIAALGEGQAPAPAANPAPAGAPEVADAEESDMGGLSLLTLALIATGIALLVVVPIALMQRRKR